MPQENRAPVTEKENAKGFSSPLLRFSPLLVFIFAMAVRAVYLWQMHDSPPFQVLLGDARLFDAWGQQIASGDWIGHEVFLQVPFYPYFIGLLYAVFGHHVLAIRIAQLLLGACACAFLTMAGKQFFSRRVGVIAGILLALYPPAIFFDGLIQKSALDLFFMALLLYLFGQIQGDAPTAASITKSSAGLPETSRRFSLPTLALTGFILSCFALTRENAFAIFPIASAWLLLNFRKVPLPNRLAGIALFAVMTISLLVVVGFRNKRIGGTFQPTTSVTGVNFYYGNNAQSDGRYTPLLQWHGNVQYENRDLIAIPEVELGRKLSSAEISSYWWRKGIAEVQSNPGAWCRLMWRKWLMVWNAAEMMDTESLLLHRRYSLLLRLFQFLHFGTLVPLAAAGLWLTRRRWRELWLLPVIALAFAASVAVFMVSARYRYPLVPFVILFAGAGLVELLARWKEKKWRALSVSFLLLTLVGLACNWPLISNTNELATARMNLGVGLLREKDVPEACQQFQQALEADPTLASAANNLAWIYATSPESALRNGREAVRLATRACELTGNNDPTMLGTLSAAYAENGEFKSAMDTAQKAISLTREPFDHAFKLDIEARLKLYETGKAFRDAAVGQ